MGSGVGGDDGGPDLHLLVSGRRVDATIRYDDSYIFHLDGSPGSLVLSSRTHIPRKIGLNGDRRRLGVLVRRVSFESATATLVLDGDSALFQDGFHISEGSARWTYGAALLPPEALGLLGAGRISVRVELAATLPLYAVDAPRPDRLMFASLADEAEADGVATIRTRAGDHVQVCASDTHAHMEGVAISPTGAWMAVAASGADRVELFRRRPDGAFASEPEHRLEAATEPFRFPHGVAIARAGDDELLAVVERRGVASVWRIPPAAAPVLVAEVSGPHTRLGWSDAVAFVGPSRLAVTDYEKDVVCFFDLEQADARGRVTAPAAVLQSADLSGPDGIAVSPDLEWLAVCNHSDETVSVFRRETSEDGDTAAPTYAPEAAAVIVDPSMRSPHSLAFEPETLSLWVTNCGARHLSLYPSRRTEEGRTWSAADARHVVVVDKETFEAARSPANNEGGVKGVALDGASLAICSPEMGVRIIAAPQG